MAPKSVRDRCPRSRGAGLRAQPSAESRDRAPRQTVELAPSRRGTSPPLGGGRATQQQGVGARAMWLVINQPPERRSTGNKRDREQDRRDNQGTQDGLEPVSKAPAAALSSPTRRPPSSSTPAVQPRSRHMSCRRITAHVSENRHSR